MEKQKEKQFQREWDYIIDKYFSDFKPLTDFKEIEDRPVYTCDILINNKPYVAYKYGRGEAIYVPMVDDIFKSDFDDIYQLSIHKEGFLVLSIKRKKDGILETIDYDFRTNEIFSNEKSVELMYYYSVFDDRNNRLYQKFIEQNVPLEVFLMRNEARLKDTEVPCTRKMMIIKKFDDGKALKATYDTYDELFRDYIKGTEKFEPIEIDDEASLCDVANKLLEGTKKELIKK